MNSKLFTINGRNIISAVVSGVLAAILAYLSNLTDISAIDVHQVISISVLTATISLLKALLTTSEGKLVGAIKIK